MPGISDTAESLAKAKDLDFARAGFKLVSNSLIESAKSHNATGTYHIAYCPMAKASWPPNRRYGHEPLLRQGHAALRPTQILGFR